MKYGDMMIHVGILVLIAQADLSSLAGFPLQPESPRGAGKSFKLKSSCKGRGPIHLSSQSLLKECRVWWQHISEMSSQMLLKPSEKLHMLSSEVKTVGLQELLESCCKTSCGALGLPNIHKLRCFTVSYPGIMDGNKKKPPKLSLSRTKVLNSRRWSLRTHLWTAPSWMARWWERAMRQPYPMVPRMVNGMEPCQ